MPPAVRRSDDLQALHRRAQCRERGEGFSLGVIGVGLGGRAGTPVAPPGFAGHQDGGGGAFGVGEVTLAQFEQAHA